MWWPLESRQHPRSSPFLRAQIAGSGQIAQAGISSFRVFLAYKGTLGVDDEELYHTLKLASEVGAIVKTIARVYGHNNFFANSEQGFKRVE